MLAPYRGHVLWNAGQAFALLGGRALDDGGVGVAVGANQVPVGRDRHQRFELQATGAGFTTLQGVHRIQGVGHAAVLLANVIHRCGVETVAANRLIFHPQLPLFALERYVGLQRSPVEADLGLE